MPTPKGQDQSEVARQMNEIWENAKVQLEELRDAVVRSSQIAKTKLDTTFLRRDRDRLLHRLGEVALKLIDAKELALAPALKAVVDEIRELDRKIASEEQEIQAILDEGEAAAKQAQAKKAKRKGK